MRAAILVLSTLIVLLSISIVIEISGRTTPGGRMGERFEVGRMLLDAKPGEVAVYREVGGLGRYLTYAITNDWPESMKRVPVKEIEMVLRDPRQPPDREKRVRYEHRVTDHFWFPLTNPLAPEAKDRVWILRSIRRDELAIGGRQRPCWRIDLVDPALPVESEHVVAWVDESVPVFGLLKWQRHGAIFELDSMREAR